MELAEESPSRALAGGELGAELGGGGNRGASALGRAAAGELLAGAGAAGGDDGARAAEAVLGEGPSGSTGGGVSTLAEDPPGCSGRSALEREVPGAGNWPVELPAGGAGAGGVPAAAAR